LFETVPKQTVSLCVIAKDAEYDLPRLLKSVEPLIDEVIVGVDAATKDGTEDVAYKLVDDINRIQHRCPPLRLSVVGINPAVETGFSEARNATIEQATCDWIMWCDCDEEMVSGERLWKYLRNNQWRGYGMPQHHFSTEPLGVLSTDYPVRVFRNHEKVRFFGIVHEHPERPDCLNEGVGFALQIMDVHFSHYGYKTEAVRRARFERNITLMARDRRENPNRILGKFLWVRDLALMCRFQLEQTQGLVTPDMREKAISGLELWEATLQEHGNHPQVIRMAKDHLEFYDTLVQVMDQGFTFKMKLASGNGITAPELSQMPELSARFLNRRHLDLFLSVIIDGEVKGYEGKYV
jgi:glycosyltransferase involved in cell wall biosynthesis